jgi:hypothetical protein
VAIAHRCDLGLVIVATQHLKLLSRQNIAALLSVTRD